VGTIAVKVTATDGSLAAVSDTFNIIIGNSNDAPLIQGMNGTATVAEDASVLLQAPLAQVTDADGDTLTMTLGVSGGTLTASPAIQAAITAGDLTELDGDGSDGTLSVRGSASAITAAIQAGITYTPNANVHGLDALDVAITDGQATATASVGINITPVNDDAGGDCGGQRGPADHAGRAAGERERYRWSAAERGQPADRVRPGHARQQRRRHLDLSSGP
jgi:hypothetical protein